MIVEKREEGDWEKIVNLITPSNLAQFGHFDANYSTLAHCLGEDVMNQYQVCNSFGGKLIAKFITIFINYGILPSTRFFIATGLHWSTSWNCRFTGNKGISNLLH